MARELWNRHMDARRAFGVMLGAIAFGLCILALAVAPGFVGSGDHDAAGFARYGPASGAALGTAVRGYAFHRRPGTRNGLRWALAQGGLMALLVLGMFAVATLINPIVSPNPTLGGDTWAGLLAIGAVLGATSNVLWERNRQRRRIAAVLVLAVCSIVVGLIGLRAGGPWTMVGTAWLVVGLIALVAAAVQGASELTRAAADSAA